MVTNVAYLKHTEATPFALDIMDTVFIFSDCGPKEDGEAFIAEVWEICRQIHHYGRFLKL